MILFIHRKDLRVEDLAAFDYIDQQNVRSVHLLILDPYLLKRDRHLSHSGVNFLRHVRRLAQRYTEYGKKLYIAYGEPAQVMTYVLQNQQFSEVVVHQDFTPYAIVRDRELKKIAETYHIPFTRLADHTLAHLSEFQQFTAKNEPYRVFTPFYRKWQTYLDQRVPTESSIHLRDLPVAELQEGLLTALRMNFPLPFALTNYEPADDPELTLDEFLNHQLMQYAHARDAYFQEGTSALSKHINLGAISIRCVYAAAQQWPKHELWIRQLGWRDFYIYQSFYDADFFRYEKNYDFSLLNERYMEAWMHAKTGIPIIDAAMTELKETGQMPNRLRMVTAMFLTKNLLCPFTIGEQYFRYMLTDYDNTLNRGGWLWSSSLGFDAAPYFRIMNPVTQSQTHDPTGVYLRRWLPELKNLSDKEIHLPRPHAIVDLKSSRANAIDVYKNILRSTHTE